MHPYVIDVEHEVTVLPEAIYEEIRISELKHELKELSGYMADLERAHEFLTLNPSLDNEELGTFAYWEKQFRSDKFDSLDNGLMQ
jgi:hypothetical protein